MTQQPSSNGQTPYRKCMPHEIQLRRRDGVTMDSRPQIQRDDRRVGKSLLLTCSIRHNC
jgi:hypothetical protein